MCSKDADKNDTIDPVSGRTIFQQGPGGEAPACASCHSTEPGKVIIGPYLAGIAARDSQSRPGMSAEECLRQSILEPNAYVIEGFPEGVMYQNFKDALSEEHLDSLISYLMTLR